MNIGTLKIKVMNTLFDNKAIKEQIETSKKQQQQQQRFTSSLTFHELDLNKMIR